MTPREITLDDEVHELVRTRKFPRSTDLNFILKLLRMAHSTGTLMVDLNCGGVGSIRFREEHKLSPE